MSQLQGVEHRYEFKESANPRMERAAAAAGMAEARPLRDYTEQTSTRVGTGEGNSTASSAVASCPVRSFCWAVNPASASPPSACRRP